MLRNGIVEFCGDSSTFCPSETRVRTFQCTVSSSLLQWQVISNGTLVFSRDFAGLVDPVGASYQNGNFFVTLTSAGNSNIQSIANITNLTMEEDTFICCRDGNDGLVKSCSLSIKRN